MVEGLIILAITVAIMIIACYVVDNWPLNDDEWR